VVSTQSFIELLAASERLTLALLGWRYRLRSRSTLRHLKFDTHEQFVLYLQLKGVQILAMTPLWLRPSQNHCKLQSTVATHRSRKFQRQNIDRKTANDVPLLAMCWQMHDEQARWCVAQWECSGRISQSQFRRPLSVPSSTLSVPRWILTPPRPLTINQRLSPCPDHNSLVANRTHNLRISTFSPKLNHALTTRIMSTLPTRQDILIVGCGIAGPVLATLLLSSSQPFTALPRITILERNTAAIGSGQNIDIRGIGKHIISKLGLTDEIKKATTGEEGVRIVDASNRIWAQYAADKTGKVETGTSDVEILRGRLAEILLAKAKRVSKDVEARGGSAVEFIFDDNLESLHQDNDKVHVQFAKGGQRTFDVVVGADGLHSKTRKLIWAQAQEECLKPLHMYGAFFSTKKLEGDGDWRSWFHASGGVSVMLRPSGTKEKSTVLVLLADKSGAIAKVMSGSKRNVEAQKRLVMKKLDGILWQEQRLKEAVETSDDFYFDVTAQVKLDKWSKDRVVLLGDAG
jgi:2-polyprenyl-6-methoxyphenol hydroxylase-like FAD-dependent oxidoreductase